MNKNLFKKVSFIQLIMALSVMVVASSLAYYFIIYLPQKESNYLEFQEKTLEKKVDQGEIKKNEYENCLEKAKEDGREAWLNRCKANNIKIYKDDEGKDNCKMKDSMGQLIRDNYDKRKEACLEIYLNE